MIKLSKGGALGILFLSTFLIFGFLFNFIDSNPIVGDGFQNLSIAKNIVSHFSFSAGGSENPDMAREPAWPALTGLVIYFASLTSVPVDLLATTFSYVFKYTNILIYALSIGVAASYVFFKTRSVAFFVVFLVLALSIYGTIPRLINNFNNEALATLLVLVNSILLHEIIKGRLIDSKYYAPVFLGISLGILALTKAQFLYICLPVFFVLFYDNKKKSFITFVALLIVVTPWLYRNYTLFGEPAIAKRGKTVAAVRIILTSEPTSQERLCLAFAFSHPVLQPSLESLLGINKLDFSQGGKCQRINREICFDMGTIKVKCAPFQEDISKSDYASKIQYFYKGYSAGQLIEKNQLSLNDIAVFDIKFVQNYLETLPLFAWRGFGFSDYPLLSLIISFSIFGLLFTQYWPFALLCVSSQLFHIFLTHNIPRYHAVEFPVLASSAIYLLWLSGRNYFLLLISLVKSIPFHTTHSE